MFHVCILVFLAVFQPAFSGLTFDDVFANPRERCLKEAGINREDLLRYLEKPCFSDIFEENRSCYVLCVGKELGKVNDNGTFNLVAMAEDAAKDRYGAILLPMYTKCAAEQGANPCETLKKNFECMRTAVRKYRKIPIRKSHDSINSLLPNTGTNA